MNVLITGASRGFGRALALAFAQRGDSVLALARSADKLASLNDKDARIAPVICDLSDLANIEATLENHCRRVDGIDVLINNAASDTGVGPAWELPLKGWQDVMNVGFFAHVEVTRVILPWIIARGSGLVVNVCSMAAMRPYRWLAPYCVSKAALKHYALCLAAELQPFGIRANSVGICARTDLVESHIEQKHRQGYYGDRAPTSAKSLPLPEENVAPVLFLASEEGKHVTGQYIECHATTMPTWG